jgi:ABC-type multidrug transport system ATPase subunit
MGAASDAESPWDVAGGLVAANAITAVAFVALLALTDQNGRAARGLAEASANVAAKVFFPGGFFPRRFFSRRRPSVERPRGEAAASAAGRGGLADASDAVAPGGGRVGGGEGLSSGLSERARARFSSDRSSDLEMGVPAEDSGVAAARVAAEASGALSRGSRVALVVRGLRVRYPGRGSDAVDGLSFAARRGECFGLLGVNGAGKSTTFGALSGALAPSDGEALLAVRGGEARREAPGDDEAPPPDTNTFSSSSSSSSSFFEIVRVAPAEARARRRVGYCPQRDAAQSTMTVAEHLAFYSALRGGPLRLSSPDVLRLASALELAAFLDVPAGNLSGGTRRKLSVAIALVGDPSLVLLDEPSAGMDPESRLAMRRAVGAQCAERGACVVVTSHAMEECEALCRSAAVMARGRARRAGKVRDLLRGLGRGYDLDARLAVGGGRTSDDGDDGANGATLSTRARRFVEAAFPGATPRDEGVSPSRARRTPGGAGDDEGTGNPPGVDEAGGSRGEPLGRVGRAARSFRYRLPPEVSAAEAFEAMEAGMEKAGIAAYQLGRPTLEEVFLRVAEEAEAEEAAEGTGVGEEEEEEQEEEERRAGEGGGEGGGATPRSHPLR